MVFFDYRITLVRRTLPGAFAFEYRLPSSFAPSSSNVGKPSEYVRRNASSLNQDPAYNVDLENGLASVLQFPVEIEDIGGTLVVELGVNNAKVIMQEVINISTAIQHFIGLQTT